MIRVLTRLGEDCPDVDVLAITAAREVGTVRRALRGGVVHYLMKPFDYADLRHRLEHYAAAHHRLADSEITDQSEVDRIFSLRPTRPTATPRVSAPRPPRSLSGRCAIRTSRCRLRSAPSWSGSPG